ncbi:MAG: autotransporter-associated beta strand repeat-containing protein [Verrucomicrobiaceae bacterium]|nr:autotransporter-associated beta strand repeat-containing protein [Verrucomicrobiaceae bacterium]
MQIGIGVPHARATDQIWNANSLADFLWSTAGNWSGGVPLSADNVLFGRPVPNPGSLPNPSIITLGAGSVANALSFKDNYTLTGGDLTLTTGGVRTDLGMMATIGSQLLGTAGLTKTGGGALRLTNASNSYTGTTTINDGIVSISNAGALGADTSAIVINGSATRGFGGGALLLEGGYSSGVTLSRGLTLQGSGPAPATGAALISVGNNTITGPVTNGAALVNTVVSSAGGRLTLGDVTLGGAAGTILMTFGTTNAVGAGSYAITGALASAGAGLGTVAKTGAGTLFLTPSSAAGYSGIFQISAGSMRVTDTAALGTSSATNAIDLNGGLFELRTDTPTFVSAKRINLNNGSGATDLLLDRGIGGTGLNQTVTFANFDYDAGETMVINTRNGYAASFTAATAIGGGTGGHGADQQR